jgi:hypothetical protein
MTVVEDSSSAPDHDEDQLDKQVGEMIALSEATCKQVCIVQLSLRTLFKVNLVYAIGPNIVWW